MAKYELKTKATPVSVDEFLEGVADEQQRADARQLIAIMARLSGHEPRMWGPSIIGFGQYHYKYASGHEGDMARIGFSPRKGQTVLYLANGSAGFGSLLGQLGKYKTGKACLYIRSLSSIDAAILEQLCAASLEHVNEIYPQ